MNRIISATLAASFLALAPTLPARGQDGATQIGWCRVDGIAGGNSLRTRGATGCNFGAVLKAARDNAIAALQNAANCPSPINADNAANRCSAAGDLFTPGAVLNLDIQQQAGLTSAERAATHLQKVGTSGICRFSRVVAEREETDLADRSCGFWPFKYNRRTVFVDARSSCGVVCR